MLTSRVCGEFESIWKLFPDDLNASGEYYISGGTIKNYCPKSNCDSNINKIHAGCLWLFNQFYGSSYNFSSNANGNMNIVVYIMIWLTHKLNKMLNTQFSNLNEFYSKHIQNTDEYKNHIDNVTEYKNYIDLINQKKKIIDIDIKDMSKFYDAFKILCNMYINVGKQGVSKTFLEYANEFVDEYQKLLNNNNTDREDSSYNQILSTLSNDYSVLGRNKIDGKPIELPSLPTEKTAEKVEISDFKGTKTVSMSGTQESNSKAKISNSDSTLPSPSQVNKLILIPIIFVATLILLGIAYKYLLFGFRKRSQKQYLREKLKK
ncbi:hypothetical protein YYC_05344 [Plasmodium yoelii 17X]|uniref:YIR protein n=1 Tax=Plasmodium yoelii 17X TaxID=1323249 RepID=V7PE06_PLAYE|nr:hypothetical protein YYC_05344 [Plasmodium yoelii 17X]